MSDTFCFTPRCRLTLRDRAILENVLARCIARNDPMVPLLRRKLAAAVVVDGEVQRNVATIDSRVAFRVNGRSPDTRVLVRGDDHRVAGLTLSVATPRGLALLGLAEGEQSVVERPDGTTETVCIDKIVFQPDAAGSRQHRPQAPAPHDDGPTGVLVSLAARRRKTVAPLPEDDDPGPSAA